MINFADAVDTAALNKTLARLRSLFKKLGITRVANVTGLDTLGLPVAVCIRPNSKHLSVSQGKGLTWELAQISAIMESVEGYHIENPQPPQLHGSYNHLLNDFPVIDPHLFTPGNFQMPASADWEMDWIAGIDWVTQKTIYLPYVLTWLDSTIPHPDYAFFNVSSNGLAAGNTLEEAICHGMHEVIERDSACKFLQLPMEQRDQRLLNLDSIDSPVICALLKQLSAANIDLTVWDISSPLGIPAFRCLLRDSNILRGLNAFMGNSANLNKEKAFIGAVNEAIQSRLTLIAGSRDDTFPEEYAKQKSAFSKPVEKTVGSHSYQTCPSLTVKPSFHEQLADLQQRLIIHNYQRILVVNHTKTELNIPVVHVFIPGMLFDEHAI